MSNKEITAEWESNLVALAVKILAQNKRSFDVDKAAQVIVDYVLQHDKLADNDANRYEKYFQLAEKAKIISEGWLKNHSREVQHYEETEPSITLYIQKTYGKN